MWAGGQARALQPRVLNAVREGRVTAEELQPAVYAELRQLADNNLARAGKPVKVALTVLSSIVTMKRIQATPNIQIKKDGPYLVNGAVPLNEQHIVTNTEGESMDYRNGKHYPAQTQYALCRCGHSANKPFCDGTHKKVGFDGTETASREPYVDQAQTIDGPTVRLTDVESLCAFARFCDPKGRIWNLVEKAADPEVRKIVEYEAAHCPAGRLVLWDRETGKAIEPKFEPSLGLIEDSEKRVSGPIWVRGGIPVISSDGTTYEMRNRVTLCRCGSSNNKPFCDGSHAA
ncbi:MAG TPA: CDGSH iron-sulfur domain-containing protein [Patescibacteria group bacterium]|nr:CDGSH iron-sulfur domain-containing protein [Patescibacteria group bacterium]